MKRGLIFCTCDITSPVVSINLFEKNVRVYIIDDIELTGMEPVCPFCSFMVYQPNVKNKSNISGRLFSSYG